MKIALHLWDKDRGANRIVTLNDGRPTISLVESGTETVSAGLEFVGSDEQLPMVLADGAHEHPEGEGGGPGRQLTPKAATLASM